MSVKKWKGILLAGGSGTRLYPVTRGVNKQLLPLYDKPMIYYPLSILLLSGIREIAIISTPEDLPRIEQVLGDGSQWGLALEYIVQPKPEGIAQAFVLAADFIGDSHICMVLGDNIFFGHGLPDTLASATKNSTDCATVFGYHVSDPERYGVVSFNDDHQVLDIEEKPANPQSNYAVTGLYFYPPNVVEIASHLTPSERGELEITDVNKAYLDKNALRVELMGRGVAWLDTGTHDSLLDAGRFVQTVEKRQGLKIACLEEIAYKQGFIDADQVLKLAVPLKKSGYGEYLEKLVQRDKDGSF